ncbi:unnamed protein product, partial [Notodromas monacha]
MRDESYFKDGKLDKESLVQFIRDVKKYPGVSDEDAAILAATKLVESQPKNRGWYRITATRDMTGSRKTQPQVSMKLKQMPCFSFVGIDENYDSESGALLRSVSEPALLLQVKTSGEIRRVVEDWDLNVKSVNCRYWFSGPSFVCETGFSRASNMVEGSEEKPGLAFTLEYEGAFSNRSSSHIVILEADVKALLIVEALFA